MNDFPLPKSQALEDRILVPDECGGMRLDVFLAEKFSAEISRSQIKKNIECGLVRIGEQKVTPHYKVKGGECILIRRIRHDEKKARPQDLPLDILYEDEDLIVVNKAPGMVVHPAHGNPDGTLVNALLYHVQSLSTTQGEERAGVVHRLDKDTSGILLIAKTNKAHRSLAKQFKNHTIEKVYHVIVKGIVQHNEGVCEEPVGRSFLNRKKVIVKPSGGKDAATYYRVLDRFSNATWLEVHPKTGRTHQIRVHMAHLDHPVLGDVFYGVPHPGISRQALHAFRITFQHPTQRRSVTFECPLPEDMKNLLQNLAAE